MHNRNIEACLKKRKAQPEHNSDFDRNEWITKPPPASLLLGPSRGYVWRVSQILDRPCVGKKMGNYAHTRTHTHTHTHTQFLDQIAIMKWLLLAGYLSL